jgi:hypothetical protein
MIEIEAVGAIAILWRSAPSRRNRRRPGRRRALAPASSRRHRRRAMCLNIFLFHTLAIAIRSGTFCACRNEWKPITPRPTERSRLAEYGAGHSGGARSMKSCSTLSRKRITSSMNARSSFHSSQVSRFSDDRQQTAVRSLPRWSRPVGSVISLHRFEVLTFRPSSRWCCRHRGSRVDEDQVGLAGREARSRMRPQRGRSTSARTSLPSFGRRRPNGPRRPSRRSMKASVMLMPWCRFSALRLKSPVGLRISRNSSISGW